MLARPHESSSHPFLVGVRATCAARGLLSPTDRVLAALSGGPDSTALLIALVELRAAGLIAGLAAAHVDHRLRADSAADGAFCAELCRELEVPLERAEVTVEPGNVQAQARRARYAALRRAAARAGANRIATGHTLSDQAETVLLRLLRGSGARGLSAIPPRRGAYVRPLLDRTRSEVLAFLADRRIGFRVDPTNASPRYLRNRVRAEVLPILRELNPSVEYALARAADLLRDDDRALDRLARKAVPHGECRLAIDSLRLPRAPLAIQRRMVRRLWRQAAGTGEALGACHVEAVLQLARRGAAGPVALPRGLEARCAGGALELGPRVQQAACGGAPVELEVCGPGTYDLPGGVRLLLTSKAGKAGTAGTAGQARRQGESEDARVRDGVAAPLWLRTRRSGDRFRPARGRGSKTLKRWLIDQRIPREQRDGLVLLADSAGQVLWIPELGARSAWLDAPECGLEVRVVSLR
jgi:tRNA(Ile)-lysidine synthase